MGIIFGFIVIAISVYGTGCLLYLDQGDKTLCGALCGQLLFGWITSGATTGDNAIKAFAPRSMGRSSLLCHSRKVLR
jgi:hypothetical protein